MVCRLLRSTLLFILVYSNVGMAANIVITLPGNVRAITAGSITLSGVSSGAPEATATNTNTGTSPITTSITTLSTNALLVDVVGSGNNGNFTPGTGQTERWDRSSANTAVGAASTRTQATPGSTSMIQNSPTSNRKAHAVIAMAPSAAGGTVSVNGGASASAAVLNTSTLNWTQVLPVGSNLKLVVGISTEDTACPGNSAVSSVTYDGIAMTRAVFSQIYSPTACMRTEVWYADLPSTPVTPTAQWRLDENQWNGTSGEVLDSIGGLNGTAFNSTTTTNGQVCNAGDFSANSNSDYLSMNASSLNGATDFTLSVWGKTSNTGTQTIFSGSTGSQHNELIMFFPNSTTFSPYLKGGSAGNIPITNIADNNWHHFVWTRSGAQNCLYIDGVLQGCRTLSTQSLSVANGGLIIGQEQDSLGGGFDTNQDWEGLIDEPMVFRQAISAGEINSIYNNQLAGNDWDGSARRCTELVAEWRMEELSWNGTAGEVVDSTGNGHNGIALNGLNNNGTTPAIAGNPGTCKYGDFDGTDDYIQIPHSNQLNGSDALTYMAWVNPDNWTGTRQIMAKSVHGGGSGRAQMGIFSVGGLLTGRAETALGRLNVTAPVPATGNWSHIALVFSGNGMVLYINGVAAGTSSFPLTTLNQTIDPLNISKRVGTNQYFFDGLIDEVRVYKSILSATEVMQIMNATHPCQSLPVADWHFDESSWNGTADEVVDSAGNNYHGRAVNASTVPGLLCNAADLTANSNSDYLTMNNAAINGLNDFTISVWGRTSNTAIQTIFSGSTGSQHNELIMYFPNPTTFTPYIKGSGSGGSINIPSMNDGNWHHYAWTRAGAQNCLFVDGVSRGCVNRSTATLNIAAGGLIIGQEQDSLGGGFATNQDWEGLIDEPLVFDRALSATEVQQIRTNQSTGFNWDGTPRVCGSLGLDHYDINTGGAAGSVCAIKQITVRACANPACSALVTNYTGTVGISTSSAVGNWSVVTGNGTLTPNPDTDNNGIVSYGFAVADSGSIVLGLDHNLAASTTVTVTDGGSVTNTSSSIQFSENAFLIDDIDSLPGVDVPVAGRNHLYRATMIARLNSTSPQCSVVTTYGGSQALKGWVSRTPSDPGGAAPMIGAVSLPGNVPGADNLTLNFTAGVAIFNLSTSDVGQYAINLREDNVVIPTLPATNVPVTVIGSSNNATVRPFALDIDFLVGSPLFEDRQTNGVGGISYAAGIGGSVFTRAGASFPSNVTGVLWQSVDDNNVAGGDGVPDAGANLTNNAPAPSFGQEGETVTLTHTLVVPGGGASGVLTGTLVNSFTGGTGLTNLAWNEVGIIDLAASLTDNDYLGSGVNVTGNVVNVGRFIPDHLVLSAGSVTEACLPVPGTNFTYLGQDFSSQYTLTAESATNTTTTNYRGAFVQLDNTQGTLDYDAVDIATVLNVTPADKSTTAFVWGNGIGTLTASLAVIKGITPLGPLNPGIGVVPTDADSVTFAVGALDLNTDPIAAGNEHKLIANSVQRFGRLRGVSAFGSETQVLPVPILAEYFNGTSFITNIDDTCTNLLAANFDLDVIDDDATPDNSNNPAPGVITGLVIDSGSTNGTLGLPGFIGGDAGFTFSAPGANNTSLIAIDLDLDEISNPLPWLKFDWTGSGDTSPPQFDAVFGRYRGSDRIIYWREVF